jgi:ATP-dependent RNA helicase DeaD
MEPTSVTELDPKTTTPDSAPPAKLASFDDMGLDPSVKQALDDMGFTMPMEVQTAVYGPVMAGKDIMVQSRTGSGKTAAFGIPIAQKLQPGSQGVQVLCLAPTRELALQVAQEMTRIVAYRNLQVVPVYGGAPMGRQIELLKAGAQIVAGTPGRVLDHIRRGTLKTSQIRTLVLDECDEMLSMGFQEEIEKIINELPGKEERQTLLFSATIPEDIERIGKRHMRAYEKLSLTDGYIGVHQITHQFYLVSGLGRTRDLLRVIEFEKPESAIIFCNTRDDTAIVAQFLRREGYDAEAISSDLTQADRERVMGRMREKNLRFLCATDIAARGIDISDLPYVINYTVPESAEVYVHRTGRTGRAGKSGAAISLVGPREIGALYYLKLLYKIRPEEREFPSERELRTRREAERYAKIAEEVVEDAGEEFASLARRVIQSAEGERIVAAILKRVLEGAPTILRDRAAEARAQAKADAEAEQRQTRSAKEPERIERAPRREPMGDRGGRRGDRPERGERRDARPERGPRRDSRSDRPERAERPERGDRPERAEREQRADRPERAPRPPRADRPAKPELTAADAPPPGGENREFWEAWADEKTRSDQKASEAAAAAGEQLAQRHRLPGIDPRPEPRAEAAEGGERERRPRAERIEDPAGSVRLYLNVGKREGLRAEDVQGMFAASDLTQGLLRVTVRDTHSYAAVKEEHAEAAINALRGKKVGERELVVERAKR